MKKFFVFFTFIMTLVIVNPSYAIDPGFYVGAGGSYAVQDFDVIDEVVVNVYDYGYSYNVPHKINGKISNGGGINLKVGYQVNDISSWELTLDHLTGFSFENKKTNRIYPYRCPTNLTTKLSAKVNVTTLMLASKLHPFKYKRVRPFVTAGVGLMHSEIKADIKAEAYNYWYSARASASESDSKISPCFKLGTGVDVFIQDNVSLGIEVAYILGTGSLSLGGQEIVDKCNYVNTTFGVAYYF